LDQNSAGPGQSPRQQLFWELSQEAGHVGTWELDLATGELSYSAEYARIHGHDPSLPPPPLAERLSWIHPDDVAVIQAAMLSTTDSVITYRILHGPDAPRYVLNRSRYLPGPEGHPGYRVGVTIDITDVEFARAAARRSDEHFRLAFNASLIGMAVLQRDWTILQVNDALCGMLGYSREELLLMSLPAMSHPDEIPEGRRLVDEIFSTDRNYYVRKRRLQHADGRWIWVEIHVAATVSADGDERMIIQVREVTSEVEYQERLKHLADHDFLTNLFNRRAFQSAVTVMLREDPRRGALLMFDLDNFKYHNDTYGHARGDLILAEVAGALRRALPDDVVARYGGDEFAIALADRSRADEVAAAVLSAVQKAAAAVSPDSRSPVTASVGIADFLEDALGTILSRADQAVYDAKGRGRNQFCRR
jgi:diguanylate cyclase (GGDEF)-like protein/PAS domain S-box-containing protein